MYKVIVDIVLDTEYNELPYDNESDRDKDAKALFIQKGKKWEVTLSFTDARPNGNFELVIESEKLSNMFRFLANEVSGDIEDALWNMVSQINNA